MFLSLSLQSVVIMLMIFWSRLTPRAPGTREAESFLLRTGKQPAIDTFGMWQCASVYHMTHQAPETRGADAFLLRVELC